MKQNSTNSVYSFGYALPNFYFFEAISRNFQKIGSKIRFEAYYIVRCLGVMQYIFRQMAAFELKICNFCKFLHFFLQMRLYEQATHCFKNSQCINFYQKNMHFARYAKMAFFIISLSNKPFLHSSFPCSL